jgi:AsmA protein
VPNENVTVDARFVLGADSPSQRLRLAAMNVTGLLARPGDARPAHWQMSAPAMDVDLYLHTLTVPEFHAGYSNARLTGKLQAVNKRDEWGATGSVTLAPLDLREFAPRRIALPKTRDPRVFAQLSGSSDFSLAPSGVRLDPLTLQLDDTHVTGHIALVGEPRTLQIELVADQIDLDRYRGEEGNSEAPSLPSAAPVAATGDSEESTAAAKHLDADGAISIGSAHVASMDFTPVHLTFASRDGVLHVFPVRALVDGGRYSGDITIDRRGAIPVVNLDEHLIGIDMRRLLAKGAYPGRLSGHGNLDLKATAQGAELKSILQSMNGHFDGFLTDGAIEGVDVGYELARAQALIHREPAPARENTRHTTFDAFKLSADIVNGVATAKDLMISSQAMRVTGQGSANLASKAIDVQLVASILKSPTDTLADIPLKITGTYAEPTVKADVDALVKGQLKQKLNDVLKKNGLGGLFGK